MTFMRIAIVGAGVSALVVAEKLIASGHPLPNIDIFEKSRGLGGRLSTRYQDHFVFDHGAPFFIARSQVFRRWLEPKVQSGLLVDWKPKVVSLEKGKKLFKRPWFEPHFVANEKMNNFGKALAEPFQDQIFSQSKVVSLSQDERKQWFLNVDCSAKSTRSSSERHISEGHTKPKDLEPKGPYDIVLLAIPGPQAKNLLSHNSSPLFDEETMASSSCEDYIPSFCDPIFFERHEMDVDAMSPEYTLMLGFNDLKLDDLKVHWDLAKVSNSPIAWISIEDSKPGRQHDAQFLSEDALVDTSLTRSAIKISKFKKNGFNKSRLNQGSGQKSLIIRSTTAWAKNHLYTAQDEVAGALLSELTALLGFSVPKPDFNRLQRWMYAQSSNEHLELERARRQNIKAHSCEPERYEGRSIYDSELGLGLCGDWLMSGDVESAFLSANSLAAKVLARC